jgi:antagonist of KipI
MIQAMASIIIESPGLLSTVQDTGRYGYQRYGMPVSGAMDVLSLQIANLLVGNKPDAAGIEATITGPSIRFTASGFVAVCGADMGARINNMPLEPYMAHAVKADDLLGFGSLQRGCRAYIAFSGGLDVPKVMGSRSTCLPAAVGGHHGRPLQSGDSIPLGKSRHKIPRIIIPEELISASNKAMPFRIIPGPEVNYLASAGVVSLLTSTYTVSEQSNRMGYRLDGQHVMLSRPGGSIISCGIAPGTIQITGSGQPIILMADRQTTGGYARVAVIASVDMSRLAQLRPGDPLKFEEVSISQAQKLLMQRQAMLARLLEC